MGAQEKKKQKANKNKKNQNKSANQQNTNKKSDNANTQGKQWKEKKAKNRSGKKNKNAASGDTCAVAQQKQPNRVEKKLEETCGNPKADPKPNKADAAQKKQNNSKKPNTNNHYYINYRNNSYNFRSNRQQQQQQQQQNQNQKPEPNTPSTSEAAPKAVEKKPKFDWKQHRIYDYHKPPADNAPSESKENQQTTTECTNTPNAERTFVIEEKPFRTPMKRPAFLNKLNDNKKPPPTEMPAKFHPILCTYCCIVHNSYEPCRAPKPGERRVIFREIPGRISRLLRPHRLFKVMSRGSRYYRKNKMRYSAHGKALAAAQFPTTDKKPPNLEAEQTTNLTQEEAETRYSKPYKVKSDVLKQSATTCKQPAGNSHISATQASDFESANAENPFPPLPATESEIAAAEKKKQEELAQQTATNDAVQCEVTTCESEPAQAEETHEPLEPSEFDDEQNDPFPRELWIGNFTHLSKIPPHQRTFIKAEMRTLVSQYGDVVDFYNGQDFITVKYATYDDAVQTYRNLQFQRFRGNVMIVEWIPPDHQPPPIVESCDASVSEASTVSTKVAISECLQSDLDDSDRAGDLTSSSEDEARSRSREIRRSRNLKKFESMLSNLMHGPYESSSDSSCDETEPTSKAKKPPSFLPMFDEDINPRIVLAKLRPGVKPYLSRRRRAARKKSKTATPTEDSGSTKQNAAEQNQVEMDSEKAERLHDSILGAIDIYHTMTQRNLYMRKCKSRSHLRSFYYNQLM